MLKSLVLSVIVGLGSFGNGVNGVSDNEAVASVDAVSVNEAVNSDTVQLDIFYMYSNNEGTFFLDPASEFENVIFVEFDSLEEWDIELDELHHGNKFVGIFDSTGWDLLGLKYTE